MKLDTLKVLSIEDFHTAAQKGETLEGQLRKGYAVEVKAEGDEAARTVSIRITTRNRDRDQDTVDPKGWQLLNYKANPVVLWGHDYWSPPVAQDIGIATDELGLIGMAQFATRDEYDFADTVYRLIKGRYLRAASVGFRALKWVFNEAERGVDFLEQELLEYSIVPVPANPEALVAAKAAGIDVTPLRAWAEKTLDLTMDEPHMVVPRSKIERAMKLLEGERTVLWVPASLGKAEAESFAKAHGATLLIAEPATKDGDGADPTPPTPADPATPAPAGDPAVPPAGSEPPATPPAAGSEVAEEHIIELEDEASEGEEDVLASLGVTAEELTASVNEAVGNAMGAKMTALTGKLD